jgi:transposase
MIVEGSFNTERFLIFIEDLLAKMQPFPAPMSVIVMDNAAIHKADEIGKIIKERYMRHRSALPIECLHLHRGMKLEYLPAYSPDFNPIELAFSLLKQKLCHHPPPSGDELPIYEYLYLQTYAIGATYCQAFYHQSGYL